MTLRRRGFDWLLNAYAGLALIYLLVPIAIIIVFSFNNPRGRFNFIWQEFSLEAWGDPFGVPGIGDALRNSLEIAPLSTPEVVLGSALLSQFLNLGTPQLGFATILIAHVMFNLSFVVITVRSRLIGFDRSLEEAAQDLGATPWETFRLVTLPLIMPGVLAAALLAFALSIDIFVIATMIFLFTVAVMILTVWQQRRAEKMAAVRPDEPEPAVQPVPA